MACFRARRSGICDPLLRRIQRSLASSAKVTIVDPPAQSDLGAMRLSTLAQRDRDLHSNPCPSYANVAYREDWAASFNGRCWPNRAIRTRLTEVDPEATLAPLNCGRSRSLKRTLKPTATIIRASSCHEPTPSPSASPRHLRTRT
jgi:hypothetical protein